MQSKKIKYKIQNPLSFMFTVFFSIEKYIKMQLKFSFQMDGILNLEIIASKLLKQFVK
jgi:hypothetical protein